MEYIQNFNNTLNSFKIKAQCVNYQKVDNYFFYDLKLSPNAKVKDIQKYSDEISLALKTPCKPSIKVLHNAGVVRLEFVQHRESPLSLFDFFTNKKMPKGELNVLLGQQVDGSKVWMDLGQNPHMIVAGSTGSGKSGLLHNIIANMLNYNDVDMYLVDPKNIEFNAYDGKIRNTQVFYSYDHSMNLLNSALELMEQRYQLLRNGESILNLRHQLFIIDEFADLIMQDKGDEFYTALCRLAQKCRAARMNIILSTQRPSVNIINGTIKANFPARIACRVASHVDSKVILDSSGAENLLGKGDALLKDNFRSLERFQIAYTTANEVIKYFGKN